MFIYATKLYLCKSLSKAYQDGLDKCIYKKYAKASSVNTTT